MPSRIIAAFLMMICSLGTNRGEASSICYDTSHFPSISRVEALGTSIRVYIENRKNGVSPAKVPTVTYTPGKGWQKTGLQPAPQPFYIRSKDCRPKFPQFSLSLKEAQQYRPELREHNYQYQIEQYPSACFGEGDVKWFGIGFYEGEGINGVGGIGRYKTSTGKLEIRRPRHLRNASATSIVVIDDIVWVGTTGLQECTGSPPMAGLVRYQWNSTFGSESYLGGWGICGFVVHDLAISDEKLWVATDLGVSRADDPTVEYPRFQNYIPDPGEPGGMRKVTCDQLYEELLNHLPGKANVPTTPFSYLFQNLAKHAPRFLERYFLRNVRRRP